MMFAEVKAKHSLGGVHFWSNIRTALSLSGFKMSNNPFDMAEKEAEQGPKKRTFAGFKVALRFNDPNGISVNTELRYGKMDVDPPFSTEGIEKLGPHGGRLRYSRGEWKTYEVVDGKEVEISDDEVQFYQEIDGQKQQVAPLDATKTWDVLASRPLDESTLDGQSALGTLIPREKIDEFGPDKDRGSSLYWVSGDALSLRALVEKLEKERLALYFPHVFRRGLTVHLTVLYPVRLNNAVYLVARTFGGTTIWNKPLVESTKIAETEKKVVVLARPVLRKRPSGVA